MASASHLFSVNYLSPISINKIQGDCLVNILLTSFIKPAAKLALTLLLSLSLSLPHTHTFPPGDLLKRGTATAYSDTIRTTDLIPSCPSTHTFNLLGRLEESLVGCLSDYILLAPGLTVSANMSTGLCLNHAKMSCWAHQSDYHSPRFTSVLMWSVANWYTRKGRR